MGSVSDRPHTITSPFGGDVSNARRKTGDQVLETIAKRFVRLIATIFVVTALSFFLTAALPGDELTALLGSGERTPELEARITEEFHLDESVSVRYYYWLGDAVKGDLGKASSSNTVVEELKNRVPVTAELALVAIFLAVILAIPLGVLGAFKEGTLIDKITSAIAQLFLSIPNYILAIFLGYVFSVKLNLLPNSSWNRISDGLFGNLETLILPAMSIAAAEIAVFSRIVRSDMIATLKENYILSARAKGMPNGYILFRHALRNSSLSLATVVGLSIGGLLGGTVIIEQIFALPGLGKLLLDTISRRDTFMIQGIVVFISVVYVMLNFIVDMLYMVLDPRLRSGR